MEICFKKVSATTIFLLVCVSNISKTIPLILLYFNLLNISNKKYAELKLVANILCILTIISLIATLLAVLLYITDIKMKHTGLFVYYQINMAICTIFLINALAIGFEASEFSLLSIFILLLYGIEMNWLFQLYEICKQKMKCERNIGSSAFENEINI